MSPMQANLPPDEGADLLLYAADLGVNFLDTADSYGSYPHIRLALAQRDFIVATKSYAYDEAGAQQSFARAVKGIGREYVDIFLLHEQESLHTLRGHEEALRWLWKKKEEGLIGGVGISTHHVEGVRAATRFGGIDVIHPILNMRGIGIADGTREEMEDALAQAHAAGIFIYGMKPLGGGHLIGQRGEAFGYALGLPFVDSWAVGLQRREEIDYAAALFSGDEPNESLARGARRRLLIQDWCEGCGRCAARCQQGALHIREGRAHVDAARCVLCGYCAPVCPQFCIKVV